MAVTFALVHGAWHGSWCWGRLLDPLRERGHGAVAMELPGEDPGAGLSVCADAIATALAGVRDDVVLVGHSLGGLVLPLAASRRPVRGLVYLAAFVPVPGESMADQFASSPEPILLLEGGRETDSLGRSRWTDPETTARVLYPDLSVEDAAWACARLRPQAPATQLEKQPSSLPPVPAVSVVSSQDRALNPAWSRRVARERLGTEPIELPAGHFAMITHPRELADVLGAAAGRLMDA